jgi:hypothetical protein
MMLGAMSTNRSWAGQVARNRARNEQRKRKAAAERTVIKAARALINSKGLGFAVYEYATLKKAVEALEKVER